MVILVIKEKIKKNKGFIQIPLLVAIIAFVIVATGASYGGFEYYKTSKIIGEADQLAGEERYDEAIEKLEFAQDRWLTKTFGIKKQEIADKIEKNKKDLEDKSKFTQALEELDEENWQKAIDSFSELPENSFYYKDAQLKIEEAKRKIIEEELGETKIAKKEAEQKAEEEAAKRAKEELEKKIAEQKLSAKEAEEKRMNADNDGDGLTYRQELDYGTSDLNPDSDSDGIMDGEDLHPAGGGKHEAQYFEWEYLGKKYSRIFHIHEDWERYYKNKPREEHGLAYLTPNDPFIQDIARELKNMADREGYNLTSFVIAFVQHIPYVYDFYTTFAEYPKYPVETIIDRNGDCEDTTYAAASIVDATGIGVALLEFNDHMALGVWGKETIPGYYYEADGKRFYYVETTGKNWLFGAMPDEYKGKQAKITQWTGTVSNGYAKYKRPCDPSPDFIGYYYDGSNYYSDSQCNNLAYCMPYKEFYYNPSTESFYWDRSCSQIVMKGCSKSTSYPGYFTDGINYYYDSRCIQKARICRASIYSGKYWDGDNFYWDSNCTQRVVPGCDKSVYYPGYFFDGWDYYSDYQCTQKASPY